MFAIKSYLRIYSFGPDSDEHPSNDKNKFIYFWISVLHLSSSLSFLVKAIFSKIALKDKWRLHFHNNSKQHIWCKKPSHFQSKSFKRFRSAILTPSSHINASDARIALWNIPEHPVASRPARCALPGNIDKCPRLYYGLDLRSFRFYL